MMLPGCGGLIRRIRRDMRGLCLLGRSHRELVRGKEQRTMKMRMKITKMEMSEIINSFRIQLSIPSWKDLRICEIIYRKQ